jgi:hypothetical protein
VKPPIGKRARGYDGDRIVLMGASLGTGVSDEKVTDFTTVGQNPLAVTRHHNSEDGVFGGSFGNWRWTYDRGVFISPTEVDVIRADGKVIYFLPNGSGGWKGLSDLDPRSPDEFGGHLVFETSQLRCRCRSNFPQKGSLAPLSATPICGHSSRWHCQLIKHQGDSVGRFQPACLYFNALGHSSPSQITSEIAYSWPM